MAVVLRGAFVVTLASLAGLVLWCTPLPKLQHASCLRPCHELDWPMICRVKIVLEMSTVVTGGSTSCPNNMTGADCGLAAAGVGTCVMSRGSRIKVLTANGLLPGPALQVCEKDILVVDVVNRVAGSAMTVHWRGQTQRETPYMDGAPMVTQCPVNSFTTFQYKFRADNPGTHLWQVQTGNDGLDALFGALIVRQSAKEDPHHDLYDEDQHFVLISELPSADISLGSVSLLINGQPFGQNSQDMVAHLNVTANRRHRLRIAYAVTSLSCPISVAVEGHSLLIIALDGHPIQPIAAQTIRLAPGERVDAVLTADQEAGDYRLTAHTGVDCPSRVDSSALLSYQSHQPSASPPLSHHQLHQVKGLSTVGGLECGGSGSTALICLPKIRSLTKLPAELRPERLDFTLYLPFDFVKPTPRSAFEDPAVVPRLNNLTLMLPSSPLLSQLDSVDPDTVCSSESWPTHCHAGSAQVCECVHVIHIPLHSPVELVLIDQGSGGEHVFHIHGHSVHVVGAAAGLGRHGLAGIRRLDRQGRLFSRNLLDPVVKDTVAVPAGGVVAMRFMADNPGYWLLHDERPAYWSRGLGAILRVGSPADFPPVPKDFPTCGSWIGPEFFLV